MAVAQLPAQRVDGGSARLRHRTIQPIPQQAGGMAGQPVAPVKTAVATAANAPLANTPQAANASFIGPQLPAPPVPLTPEKQPPAPPRISFQNGLLTLESTNSRLSDILNGIRTKANIQFEGLELAPERVAVKLGPAPADEVLASLLQGSRFDYVILGQPENPHTVERVLLSSKSSGSPGPQAVAVAGQPPLNSQQPPNEIADEASEEETVEQPQQAVQQPIQQPVQQPVFQQPVPSPGISGVPTPEELANRLREEQLKQQGQPLQGPNNTAPIKRPPLPQ